MNAFLIIIAALFAVAGMLADFFSSKDSRSGAVESNKIFRDARDGDFQEIKYLIFNSLLIAVGVLCAVLFLPVGIILLFAVGALRLNVARKNYALRPALRAKQINYLRALNELAARGALPDEIQTNLAPLKFYFNEKTGTGYFLLFSWVRSSAPRDAEARAEVAAKLTVLARQPENEWFK